MASVFDILKETRKDNCGKCGYPTCLAFAAAVHSGAVSRAQCPFIKGEGSKEDARNNRPDPETTLVRQLRAKIRGMDLSRLAPGLGGRVVETEKGKALELFYLGRKVFLSQDGVTSQGGEDLETRDQILLYNYLFFKGNGPLSGRWVGLESFPNSMSKVVTLKKYTEERLAQAFKSRIGDLIDACLNLDGKAIEPCYADACILVPVLPRVPIQIHFWDEDEEDGFPAKVKVLFDERALDFLDIESLIFASERLAETLTGR